MPSSSLDTEFIVNAGVEHSIVLAELHFRSFPEAAWDSKSISRILFQETSRGLIYCISGVPIGFVIWQEVVGEAEILTICIDPEWRGKKYSRALIEKMLFFLKQCKVSKLFLEVSEDNFTAISLYSNVGFKEVGRRLKYYHKTNGELVDAIVMQLNIMQ
ncbi:ribosomal protein S18-alanine N-acetyltransferase [Kiloniella antarctica]|uniref:Ribosomal protein S18-alanine N-acetyltransferase n=1 Tax=Kiloniella antarctica TaxID=1550907 RepID=A0ABW5BGY4_9PROT